MGTLGESALNKQYADAGATSYGDWIGGYYRDGFAVVKGCIPEERAKHYQSKALNWRQSFNLGFDPKDESIWTKAHLPEDSKEECTLTIRSHMRSSCGCTLVSSTPKDFGRLRQTYSPLHSMFIRIEHIVHKIIVNMIFTHALRKGSQFIFCCSEFGRTAAQPYW